MAGTQEKNKHIALSKTDLNELVSWLDTYNRQFSLGALGAKAIMAGWREEDGEGADSAVEQRVSSAEIELRTRVLLEKSGLILEPIHSGGFILSSDKETGFPSKLRINLGDGKQFLRYLASLEGNKLSENQRGSLVRVAEDLTAQLTTQYDLENAEDGRLLELFGNANKIISEYERMDSEGAEDLSVAVSELRQCLDLSKKGYLREDLLVRKEGLLAEVGGRNFGPSQWHIDSDKDSYWKRWEDAIETVRVIEKNPKAYELLAQVKENLRASIDYAKRDIATKVETGKAGFDWWNNEAFQFLDNIREQLEKSS